MIKILNKIISTIKDMAGITAIKKQLEDQIEINVNFNKINIQQEVNMNELGISISRLALIQVHTLHELAEINRKETAKRKLKLNFRKKIEKEFIN